MHVNNNMSNSQLSSIGPLNVCFWNIHGQTSKFVGNKFCDPEFLNILATSHIVGFVELHTAHEAYLPGFELIKQKFRQKTHNGPNIAGGLSVFVKNEYNH